jgi:cytoskeletal protein CcmA (bactofilin family)
MWNKRNDPPSPQPPATPPRPATIPTPIQRQEPLPPPPPPEPKREKAIIGRSVRIKGDIFAKEELVIDGEVEGNITLQDRLTVGDSGKVKASIKAREVIVFGTIQGNVEVAEKIAIRDKGSLVGDIKTAGIAIDDGAYFKGSIDIVKTEPARQRAANE